MAIPLTDINKTLSEQISINPQAVLQIEGVSTLFGVQPIVEFARWDSPSITWDSTTYWDGLSEIADSRAVIDLDVGTTKNITQQILPDKGGSSSVSSVNVQMVDLNNEIAQILSLDNITEILGKKADFYIGFKQAPFPESAIPIFRGVIVDFYTEDGAVMVSIAHPETLKRQSIFQQYINNLNGELKYQKKTIQDITFQQRDTSLATLSIEYVSGGTFGASYNSTLNRVIVIGMAGKTADDIESLISNTQSTLNVVITGVSGTGSTVQSAFGATALDIDTTAVVNDTTNLLPSADVSTTHIRIDDEIIEVSSIDSGTNLTIIRGAKSTTPTTHDDDTEVESVYNITGNPVDVALKLMLSDDENTWFISDDLPKSVNFVDISNTIANSLIFSYYDIGDLTGLVKGDSVRLTGANAGTYTIKTIGTLDDGSFITVNETLTTEIEFAGTFEYRSQYNVLPDGLGMLPNNVDIKGHTDILAQFPSNFVDYDFNLTETIDDVKEFIDKDVYFPQGLYTINRKARSSVKIITPPFSSEIVPTIDINNIMNITKIKQRRSLHKFLYNVIRFDYNKDVLEDKFLTKDIIISNDSLTRIKGGKRQLKIESLGLTRGTPTSSAIEQVAQRMIDRYKFAPTYFEKIQVKYSDGFNLEVGDVLPFGGLNTQIVNINTGTRGVEPELFEVINKSLNIKTGEINVTLLSTSFSIDSRAAVVSLASGCGTNSTTTKIELVNLVDTGEYAKESDKWDEFAGLNVRVYKKDYTEDETVELIGVDPANDSFLLLDSALTFTPTTEHIIGIPEYDNADSAINSTYKLRFAHYVSQVLITSVISTTVFDVDDVSELHEGSKIVVSSTDYTSDSFGEDYLISEITGSTLTLDTALPFTPAIGFKVERSDFKDGGKFYSII